MRITLSQTALPTTTAYQDGNESGYSNEIELTPPFSFRISNQSAFFYGNASINGVPVENGDIIAAFAKDVEVHDECIGTFTIGGPTDLQLTAAGDYGALAAYGDDTITPIKDGASDGDIIYFKIWDKSEDKIYDAIPQGPDEPTWSSGTTKHVDLNTSTLYGDVSGNGAITAYDAALIMQVVVGILNLNDPDYPYLTLERADVTGNGTVSALDAALVLQYTVGLITDFPKSLNGVPALEAKIESKLLTEAIERLENVPLDKEGQQVLESLKRLIAKLSPPIHTALFQNFPNPFNPETWIPFELANPTKVTIRVYNTKGQLIRTLHLGYQKAGIYTTKDKAVYWDGEDSLGEKVASGVYFYTLQVERQRNPAPIPGTGLDGAGEFRATRKMLILK